MFPREGLRGVGIVPGPVPIDRLEGILPRLTGGHGQCPPHRRLWLVFRDGPGVAAHRGLLRGALGRGRQPFTGSEIILLRPLTIGRSKRPPGQNEFYF